MTTPRPDLTGPARLLFRVGLGLLLLSLLFTFRYAIVQGWIGPAARIAVGAVAGAALLGLGVAMSRTRPFFAVWLEGTGVAALYVTAFAAHRLYGMTTPTEALIQLAAVSAVAVGVAVRERSQVLATVGLVGALAAPLLLPGRIDAVGGDYGYVAVVLAVASALYLRSGWLVVQATTVAAAGIVVAGDGFLRLIDVPAASTVPELQVGVTAVWAAGWLVPTVAAVAGRFEDRLRRVYVPAVASAVVPLSAFAFSVLIWLPSDSELVWAGVAAALSVVHAALALRRPDPVSRSVEATVAVVFLVVASALALSGDTWVLAATGVGVATLATGRRIRLAALEVAGHVVVGLAGVVWWGMLTLTDLPATLGSGLAEAAVPLLWVVAAVDRAPSTWEAATRPTRIGYGIATHLGVMVWAAARLSAFGPGEAAVTTAWGAVGVVELVAARHLRSRVVGLVGFATVMVAVAKLILVDMATVEPVWRILTFGGFGLVLAVLGFWLGTADGPSGAAPGEGSTPEDPASATAPSSRR